MYSNYLTSNKIKISQKENHGIYTRDIIRGFIEGILPILFWQAPIFFKYLTGLGKKLDMTTMSHCTPLMGRKEPSVKININTYTKLFNYDILKIIMD